jgi:CheY-like chemotaxis protein/HPt (histidine-containing phosphotransfer) domain-containing protein
VARVNGVTFEIRVEPGVPARVVGDQTRVAQVLRNLVSNAVKFTAAGTITVTLAPSDDPDDPDRLTCAVADTGVGIDPEQLDMLFQPFAQADAGTARRYGGTGLGLSISRQLTELMGGTISASGTPGRGSTFTFEIPFGHCTAEANESDAADESLGGSAALGRTGRLPVPTRRVRILVAEDHAASWFVLHRLLSRRGHEVLRASDGRQALALLSQGGFDMVLMDCQMPAMDGYEVTRRWRAQERSGATRVPIIGMTAATMSESRARSFEAGMDDHVVKPLEPATLDRLVARWGQGGSAAAAALHGDGPPPPPPPDDVPEGLDAVRVRQLRALFAGADMATMIDELRAEVVRDLEEVRAGAATADSTRVTTAAHRIRNTGRVLGAAGLVRAAAQLDARPSEPRVDGIDSEAVATLHARWAETEDALRALLAG